jgi:hypothetical protein
MQKIIWLLLASLLITCIDPIRLEVEPGKTHYVIDGFISNEPGPYEIRVRKSMPFQQSTFQENVRNAIITITDQDGNISGFSMIEPGIYHSTNPDFQGKIGNIYTLEVLIGDIRIISSPQLLRAVPELDSLSYRMYRDFFLSENNVEVGRLMLDILADFKDISGENNYYRWNWEGTFRILTRPDLKTKRQDGEVLPNPPPCSIGNCICCECWIETQNAKVKVTDDLLFNGKFNKDFKLFTLVADPFQFQNEFELRVKGYSLNEDVYKFWQLIEDQQNNTGTIFEKPPASISGNLFIPGDPNDIVLGYFGASAVTESKLFIRNVDLPIRVTPPERLKDDCRLAGPKSSNVMPEGWTY